MRFVVLAALAALAAACGSPSTSSQGPAPAAAHAFPAVEAHAGVVLAQPHVVTVTWARDARADDLEAFGAFVVGSSWLATVGADYGVGHGTHEVTRLTEAAPELVTDAGIAALLGAAVGRGELRAPAGDVLYLLYAPKDTTVVGAGDVGTLCREDGFGGYHGAATHEGTRFAYAVVADCTGHLDDATTMASHELVEAATDPYAAPDDGYYLDAKLPSPWWGAAPSELADLCEDEEEVTESRWALTRVWSASAAAAGKAPCVPAAAGEAYANVSASPEAVQSVKAGGSFTFTLTGWSSAPREAWSLTTGRADRSDFDPTPRLARDSIAAGETTTVTLTAPASAKAGDVGVAYVHSEREGRYWPVGIAVE